MEITFWGTRGSIASPGRTTVIYGGNTTCLEVSLNSGRTVVIDAGTGIRTLGDLLMSREGPVDIHLLLTHIHWDHLVGFPFFTPLFQEDSKIVVDGCARAMEGLRRVFSKKLMDGTWPVTFDDLKACIENPGKLSNGKLRIEDTFVESHSIQHPQGGVGFRFTDGGGTFVFLTDNELREDGWKGTCFSDFTEFCRNADLLVHDCQYLPSEMEIRSGWGHSDTNSVVRLALEAGVKRLVLTHHDPWRTDREVAAMVDQCAEQIEEASSSIIVEAAREGAVIQI